MNELERLRQIEKQSIAEGLLDDLKALLGKVGIGQSDADKIAADAEKAAKAAGAAEEEVMSQDVKPSKEWAIMPNGKRGNFNIDRSLPYVDTVKNGKKERTYADKAALQKMFGQDAQIQGITDTGADQATGDVGADGMTNAERDSGAGVGLDAFGGSGEQQAAAAAGPDDGTRGGQQPNATAQQQPAAPQQQKYTVKPGDNLTKIAKAKGVKVQDVIKANPQITNPNLIYPNQEINIPAKAGESMIGNNRRNSRKMNEASMNISMNGSTAAEVAELVAILKNAGMDHSSTMAMAMEPEPEMMGPEPCSTCGKVHGPEMPSPCGMGEETVGEEWDNAPDEDYRDDDYMIHDLSGGLNRKKKAYAKAQDGDNAMAVREQLMREWKKTKLG